MQVYGETSLEVQHQYQEELRVEVDHYSYMNRFTDTWAALTETWHHVHCSNVLFADYARRIVSLAFSKERGKSEVGSEKNLIRKL